MAMSLRFPRAALLLLCCVAPGAFAADSDALESAAQAWVKAFNARDADALGALVTPGVMLMDPVIAIFRGKSDARAAWQQAFRSTGGDRLSMQTQEIVIEGGFAWRLASIVRHSADGSTTNRGQALEIWQRERGQWLLHRQMSTAMLSPPQMLPLPEPEPLLDR